MKTTATARLLKANTGPRVRPIMLVQEKLARTRLLQQLTQSRRALLDAINAILAPLVRGGHGAACAMTLTEPAGPQLPEPHHAWFALRYQQKTLGWWRIDRCSLDQLASSYYGSLSTPLHSPLRQPSQSEFRLAKKLFTAAVAELPTTVIDVQQLEITLVASAMTLDAPAVWSIDFGADNLAPPMLFCMTEHLLALMAEQPKQAQASGDLPIRLNQWLKHLPLTLQLTLGHHGMPVQSLKRLAIDDIIPINLHPKMLLTVGKRPLFYATVHSHEGQMVAKLTQDISQQEDTNLG
ncbi:FliM/FliN family flagellar motor switch protein [Shewanella salipaludis]|uniref:Flagellar motor switch protein FliN-like C-terminal domain-containing protein n=1 Tax=Shewanella salipaludis TaxID=2723052 RepID=A0A972G0U4_9GAMM|nr:FliM/FliN family flagellar motor C-terminal domain-containing protein [Shewanella salipaludis]NMH66748.1 hypothetical protein [Shewanella salipaludis]